MPINTVADIPTQSHSTRPQPAQEQEQDTDLGNVEVAAPVERPTNVSDYYSSSNAKQLTKRSMDSQREITVKRGDVSQQFFVPDSIRAASVSQEQDGRVAVRLIGTTAINVTSPQAFRAAGEIAAWFMRGAVIRDQVPFEDLHKGRQEAVLARNSDDKPIRIAGSPAYQVDYTFRRQGMS